MFKVSRRQVIAGGAATAAVMGIPSMAFAKTTLRFADVTTADAPRSQALVNIFAKEIGDNYDFKPYFGSTLLKQGTELVAVQRGNLEMAMLPPSDFAKQAPEFDILGAAYVVRSAAHLQSIFDSDVGDQFRKIAREKLRVEILAPAYYGARHVNLRGNKKVMRPEDLAGVKMRMPGGESWQFLGKAIGANPVPMDYAEVYTGLQTGAIDAQDNPLPNDKLMKFYEVTNQIILTGHNIGFGLLLIGSSTFDALPKQNRSACAMPLGKPLPGARQSIRSRRRISSASSSSRSSMSTNLIWRPSAPMRRSNTCNRRFLHPGLPACSKRSTRFDTVERLHSGNAAALSDVFDAVLHVAGQHPARAFVIPLHRKLE